MIALIITIIVLLILAGVTINLTVGDRGIFKTAKGAAENYTDAAKREEEELARFDNSVDDILSNLGQTGGGGETTTPTEEPIIPTESATSSSTSSHLAIPLSYTWSELSSVAKVISDNYGTEDGKINNTTTEVNVTVNGKQYTLGIGDTTTVDSKQVRILGFNHDELVDQSIYGGTNTYAGISFEYVDFLIDSAQMRSSNSADGGWGSEKTTLRTTLNETTINSLENKDQIKQVKKVYGTTYNSDAIDYSNDYLWLLSSAEIWNTGYKSTGKGVSLSTEGEQYAYYKSINATYNSDNNTLKKPSSVAGTSSSGTYWWLRSLPFNNSWFCFVDEVGKDSSTCANYEVAVAPGFAI